MGDFKPGKMVGVTVQDADGTNWTVDVPGFYMQTGADYLFYPSTMGMVGMVGMEAQQAAYQPPADSLTMESLASLKAENDKLRKKVKKLKRKVATIEVRNQELESLLFKRLGMEDGQSKTNGQQAVRRDADDAAGREQKAT
jgi:hypothetical protein